MAWRTSWVFRDYLKRGESLTSDSVTQLPCNISAPPAHPHPGPQARWAVPPHRRRPPPPGCPSPLLHLAPSSRAPDLTSSLPREPTRRRREREVTAPTCPVLWLLPGLVLTFSGCRWHHWADAVHLTCTLQKKNQSTVQLTCLTSHTPLAAPESEPAGRLAPKIRALGPRPCCPQCVRPASLAGS